MLSKYKRLSGLSKFNVVWNPAWFLLTAYWAVTLHSSFEAVLMVMFGVFTVLAFYFAKAELDRQDRLAVIDRATQETLDQMFRNTRK